MADEPSPFRLRLMREAFGYTQRELAERIGLTANYLAQLERGEVPLQMQTWLAVRCVLLHRPRTPG